MSRVVVVANRVPSPQQKEGVAGGLAVGVTGALRDSGGMWFGWSGKTVPGDTGAVRLMSGGPITYATVDLNQKDFDDYYNGYSNRVLWPLFHYRMGLVEYERTEYEGYLKVNQMFANRLRPLLRESDAVWVHDYHLIPLGNALRQLGVRQPLGFFLHTPFPAWQVLLTLPNHAALVRALTAYDLVGFQTAIDVRAFCDYVVGEAGGTVAEDGTVEAFGHRFRVGSYPIGIDPDRVAEMAREAAASRAAERLRASLGERKLIIGVDRLDYSKGLLARFRAFERLLEREPSSRRTTTFIQIAPSTREQVPEYLEIRNSLEQAAGRVNGRYAEFDWTPLRYLNRTVNRPTLMGFLRLGQVGFVSPLRDGMNLVAKEYVAAQDEADPGALVLSRFAGAARELDAALIVNPYDIDDMAQALYRGLTMPLDERRQRWRSLIEVVRRNDADSWRANFLRDLEAARQARGA